MIKFKEVFIFDVADLVKEGNIVYVLDKREKEIIIMNEMSFDRAVNIVNCEERGRYYFWTESCDK